ncbi:MAG: hypothetical protein D3909_09290 [Candidatus Electrothrix sp. ATG1]|nr:hypothetical protein [Candidatus Electrothrix sp. ATG1]MCI5208193.1 hypothetical protein [Candidatus Electrothrix sp. ATG2]
MTANRQKIYAFARAIELIEKSANNNHSLVSDEAFQALYNSYEKLTEMFMTTVERRSNSFLLWK